MYLLTALSAVLVAFASIDTADAFNNPVGVDVWCGKPYRATNASFLPGGWLEDPTLSSEPLLDLQIRPRMNLYVEDDRYASFIVDARISHILGEPYYNTSFDKQTNLTNPFTTLFIDIQVADTGLDLLSESNVTVNSTSNEFVFSLTHLPAQFEPYNITLTGASGDGALFYTATTQLYRLPNRSDGGSVVKIDSLYGGLLVQDYKSNSKEWTPLFPFSYYVSWDGWLEHSIDDLNVFKDEGYNIIHIVPNAGLANEAFDFDELNTFLDRADELGLWLMYDMRWTYKNLSSVEYQVDIIKARKSMLLWYTGDEPDGQTDPLNATKITYDLIKSLDAYHPVSLCLNCHNFYYEEYTSGADIILSDVYPVAVNTSYSSQYDTPCNATYGCCGCDDCNGNFEDISERLEDFSKYEAQLGLPPKAKWGVPQAFGNETFWSRYPSPAEEVVMNMLSVNHNAKGIVMWDYPTEPGINNITSALSKVLTSDSVSKFLLGTPVVSALAVSGAKRIDVSAWTLGDEMLVSIVNLQYADLAGGISITLPSQPTSVKQALWGDGKWTVSVGGIVTDSMLGLESDLIVLSL